MLEMPSYMQIQIERWEDDASWSAAITACETDTPWRDLRRDLLFLRVREPTVVLHHFGIMPHSTRAIAETKDRVAALLLSKEDRAEIMAGNYEKLIEALYEPNPARDAKMAKYYEDCKKLPDFVVENMKRFAQDGARAFREHPS